MSILQVEDRQDINFMCYNLVQVCNWNVTQNGTCAVKFFSNPRSRFISLARNGQTVTSDGSMAITAFGQMQTFEFYRTQVTSLDHGAYVLIVQSSNTFYFPNTVSISFEIKVSGISPDNPAASGLSTGAIVGISCGAAALILSVAAAYAYFKWRQAPNKKNNSATTNTNMTSSQAIQDESDYIEPNKIENIPESQEQYAEVGPSVDNAGYIDLNKEFNTGGSKQSKSLEGPYEEVKNL
ncbi:uncharacterized protein LOC143446241 isoform X2 [Clavelina lepadiformis]|uniref:uncharacterized protein LOC143446241 isoform X2 n=1 Tax=Clavelina lepadiformis TaxID=159417 RepID=UPI004041CE58